ncbi:MAG: UpxY family transcription antiterminator [Muribaculaceae bacterium]|nr:UpxY family transcription antiterminator [Muribaculaceae bacterium]
MQKDKIHWFPMRVTYNRELKIKGLLDELQIENFVPMRYDYVQTRSGKKKMMIPAIRNLIFVKSSRETLTRLKMSNAGFEPMRYMTRKSLTDGRNEIIYVPDKQMDNFMRVASIPDDRIIVLDNADFINKVGKRVEITEGYFAGVEGVIKRIKRNKHVVVQIDGVAAVAIAFVPASCLSFIDKN